MITLRRIGLLLLIPPLAVIGMTLAALQAAVGFIRWFVGVAKSRKGIGY